MLAVQNYRMTPSHVAFKAGEENQDKPVLTNNNNTHAGVKTGAVYAGLGSFKCISRFKNGKCRS